MSERKERPEALQWKYTVIVTLAIGIDADSPIGAQSKARELIHEALLVEDEDDSPIVDMITAEGLLHVLDRGVS